jgi:hypothetical protein
MNDTPMSFLGPLAKKRQDSATRRSFRPAEEAIVLAFYNWEAALNYNRAKWNQITSLHLVVPPKTAANEQEYNQPSLDPTLEKLCWREFLSLHTVYIDEQAVHKIYDGDSKTKLLLMFKDVPNLARVVFTENEHEHALPYDYTIHELRLRMYGLIRRRRDHVRDIMFSSSNSKRSPLPILDEAFVGFVGLFNPPLRTLCIPVMSFGNLHDPVGTTFSPPIPKYEKMGGFTADHVSVGLLKINVNSCEQLVSALWTNLQVQTVGIVNRRQLQGEAAACHITNTALVGETDQARFLMGRKEYVAHKRA